VVTNETLLPEESDEPQVRSAPLIRSMRVTRLFGRYTYTIRPRGSAAPPVILLYGDNGSGKTTILNILWHLLSSAYNRSHRTRLAQTPFQEFSVSLSNGDIISVRKKSSLTGSFDITVTRGRTVICKHEYLTDARGVVPRVPSTRLVKERIVFSDESVYEEPVEIEREIVSSEEEPDRYIDYLETIKIDPYFLADNRRIYSDRFKEEDPEEAQRRLYMIEGKWVSSTDRSGLAGELTDALRRTNNWLRQQILSGTAQGSQGADAIYLEVLSQLLGTTHVVDDRPSLDEVKKRIAELDARTRQFNEFGLVPHVTGEPFLQLLNQAPPSLASLIEDVLTPYLDGQRARLDSLQPTESLIRTFVETVNSFLVNKRLAYTVRGGLRIRTIDGGESLGPEQLSSGERQLLLLLCNALRSRDESALFIIDEPEISLNAKWQRKLIPALLACVQASNVQFILATHSVEIITGHREFLAQLHSRSSEADE